MGDFACLYICILLIYVVYCGMNKKYIKYIDYIVNNIELPFLKSLEQYGLSPNEYELILSKVYNESVTIKDRVIYNNNGNKIYYENSYGSWDKYKYKYNTNGKVIYHEDSNGFWSKREYDTNGNKIYYENSNGDWVKRVYDTNGNRIYYETSNGYWEKYKYNTNGNKIYYENSYGHIEDNR